MAKINIILILFVAGILACCEYDNYEEPHSRLNGHIVYEGEPINVAYNALFFHLYEPGWQLSYPIRVEVAQDGSYSALLFDGEYKLIIDSNQGPFRNLTNPETQSDTILVSVKGETELDIEVEPYYMIRNASVSVSGQKVTANFGLEQIIKDEDARSIEEVFLCVHKRQFVDNFNNLSSVELEGVDIEDMDLITMSINVPEMTPPQDYAFVRLGVKISGVEDFLFSEVFKVEL
ncbi:DUF3823 domain-containing protein [Thermophagus sp. OGC60D27]|uniref:DUF3823 domain-containing protein n=1 Tax=Thermophagus sp. OGC60D27 TaxID=3458415 RepID=UPI004037B261